MTKKYDKKTFLIALLSFILGGFFQKLALSWDIPFLKEWYGFLSIIIFGFIIYVVIYNLFLKKRHAA